MRKIVCPSCGGSGSLLVDGDRGPCCRCGGSVTYIGERHTFRSKCIEKNGSGYIYIEDEGVCNECGGSGWIKLTPNREMSSYEKMVHRRESSPPSPTRKRCSSCDGTGYQKRREKPETACFPYETLIDTPYGKVKIGELKKGQMVLSYDDGKLVPRVITRKRVRGKALIFRVEFSTGKTLLATGHHSFLTQDGWKRLADILPGDKITCSDGTTSTVESATRQKTVPVFNIYTAGEHNFIADGCVAHNFTEFRAVRTIFHRLFLDPVSRVFQTLEV